MAQFNFEITLWIKNDDYIKDELFTDNILFTHIQNNPFPDLQEI